MRGFRRTTTCRLPEPKTDRLESAYSCQIRFRIALRNSRYSLNCEALNRQKDLCRVRPYASGVICFGLMEIMPRARISAWLPMTTLPTAPASLAHTLSVAGFLTSSSAKDGLQGRIDSLSINPSNAETKHLIPIHRQPLSRPSMIPQDSARFQKSAKAMSGLG